LLYSRHGALPLAPWQTAISQHAVQQVYAIKTREYYCVYYLLAIFKAQRIINMLHLCLLVADDGNPHT
jgi:hypothetical protein